MKCVGNPHGARVQRAVCSAWRPRPGLQAAEEVARRRELTYVTDAFMASFRGLVRSYAATGEKSLWRRAAAVRAPTLVVASVTQSGDPVQDEEDLNAAAVATYIVLVAAHGRGHSGAA